MTTHTTNTMLKTVPLVDQFAIGVSVLCVVHCLFTPILILALPSLGGSIIGGEHLHTLLIYIVIPSSLVALSLGCKLHRRASSILIGVSGLCLLIAALLVESFGFEVVWETIFTVAGACLIGIAHIRNFKQCRSHYYCRAH